MRKRVLLDENLPRILRLPLAEHTVVTTAYEGNIKQTLDILQTVLATEIVCVLRYTMNAVAAAGISSDVRSIPRHVRSWPS